METDELLELTVDEQKDELENLDLDQLKELREAEDRNTAIDNIDIEINNKVAPELEEKEDDKGTTTKVNPTSTAENVDSQTSESKTDLEKLEKKVDYILEKSKTVSHEGFDNYEN